MKPQGPGEPSAPASDAERARAAAEQVEAEQAIELPNRVALSIVDPAVFHPITLPLDRTSAGTAMQSGVSPKDR